MNETTQNTTLLLYDRISLKEHILVLAEQDTLKDNPDWELVGVFSGEDLIDLIKFMNDYYVDSQKLLREALKFCTFELAERINGLLRVHDVH